MYYSPTCAKHFDWSVYIDLYFMGPLLASPAVLIDTHPVETSVAKEGRPLFCFLTRQLNGVMLCVTSGSNTNPLVLCSSEHSARQCFSSSLFLSTFIVSAGCLQVMSAQQMWSENVVKINIADYVITLIRSSTWCLIDLNEMRKKRRDRNLKSARHVLLICKLFQISQTNRYVVLMEFK